MRTMSARLCFSAFLCKAIETHADVGGLRGRVGKCNGAIERLTRFGVAPEAAGLPRGTAALAG
jgi:hypothetical protein